MFIIFGNLPSEIKLPRCRKREKMTTLGRAYIAIRIYPLIVATRFRQKKAIFGTTPRPKSLIANKMVTFNFPKNRPKERAFRMYLRRFPPLGDEPEITLSRRALREGCDFPIIAAIRFLAKSGLFQKIGQKWKFLHGIPRAHHSEFRKNRPEVNRAYITTSSLLHRISSPPPLMDRLLCIVSY